MARRVVVREPDFVRALIAAAILDGEAVPARLGSVRLREHQVEAVARTRESIRRYGGALLADAVGLGKTYVALAVARSYKSVLVVAPAVLRSLWAEAAGTASVPIVFVSTESLGRREPSPREHDFVIVDEAHHFRSPTTGRYRRLAGITATARVLLLTATPLHNRSDDLAALLALFLGASATALQSADLARCVIRREHSDLPELELPRLPALQRREIPGNAAVVGRILSLPPPLPPRDGISAGELVTLGLAHMWTSSDAAFIAAARRRLAIGSAMRDSLVLGRVPTHRELRTWSTADATMQLALPDLIVEPAVSANRQMIESLDAHLAALREVLAEVRRSPERDSRRAQLLREIRESHSGERIIAFSSYGATVFSLYRALSLDARVAALASRGGSISSGRIGRDEVLRMFQRPTHERERVDLLIATDLLSEGLNLPEASVIIHLDLPWTAARLEQRVGRARRPGGNAPVVTTYAFVQPPEVERWLRREQLIRRKARLAATSVGMLSINQGESRLARSPPRAMEQLRRILAQWRSDVLQRALRRECNIPVAAVRSEQRGFIGLVGTYHGPVLLCGAVDREHAERQRAGSSPAAIARWASRAAGEPTVVRLETFRGARRAIDIWMRERSATVTVGADAHWPESYRHIVSRLDRIVTLAPGHARRGTAQRAATIRAALSRRLSRGLELAAEELHRGCEDDERYITELGRLLAPVATDRVPTDAPASGSNSAGRCSLVAVLLLDHAV